MNLPNTQTHCTAPVPSGMPVGADVAQPDAAQPDDANVASDEMRRSRQNEAFARFSSQTLNLVEQLAAKPDFNNACLTLVNRVCEILGCDRVAITWQKNDHAQFDVVALSGTDSFDKASPVVGALKSLSDKCRDLKEPLTYPSAEPTGHDVERDIEQDIDAGLRNDCVQLIRATSTEYLVCVPIRDPQSKLDGGFLILTGDKLFADSPEAFFATRLLGDLLGAILSLQRRSQQSDFTRARSRIGSTLCGNRVKLVAVAFSLLAIAMFVPVTHKIKSDCVIQPVSRRFVAAPFDSKLETSHVTPGDLVQTGDLLATLEASELRMEISSLEAALQRESKQFESALASRNIAQSQIARHEMQKLELDLKLKQNRLASLEIRSPISGVIVSGDMKQSEGSPLTVGQTMFEIAPLENMVVELLIPEEEVAYVSEGMQVSVRTDAFPLQPMTGTVERIHPRSEMRADQSVYVAELMLDNSNDQLRPGMSGNAKLSGQRRPLGWILFHRAYEKTLFFFSS